MVTQIQELPVQDFRGGVNYRADAFQLGDNECSDILNLDIDPRGGFYTRNGFVRVHTTAVPIGVAAWDPRMLHLHELSTGGYNLYLVNGSDDVYASTNAGSSWTAKTITPAASPHGVDMARWGDTIYYCAGATQTSGKFDSTATKTTIVQAETGTWSAYATPTTCFPWAQVIASHQGYMFAGGIEEDGVEHPNRLRWSHPNDPEAWLEADYIDILEGGGKITALVPMADHLLVFQESAVWALYGYDSSSWQLVNLSREVGAIHRQAVARNEQMVFFYSHPHGVYGMVNGSPPQELSDRLRPLWEEGTDFDNSLTDDIWLGWTNLRLYVSLPYNEVTTPTTADTCFVWDPTLGQLGSWTKYRTAMGAGIGPFASGGHAGDEPAELAACRDSAFVVDINGTEAAQDNCDGTTVDFNAYIRTRWFNYGLPTRKKRWRRPDVVAKLRAVAYALTFWIYYDYNEGVERRDVSVNVPAGGNGGVYGEFVWGDGTLYGGVTRGSTIVRAGNLGSAKAVQFLIKGEAGKQWGVDALTLKLVPRRAR